MTHEPLTTEDVPALEKRIHELEAALETRATIARAQGILMERYEVDADAAFAALQRISSQSNLPVREIARYLVETGRLPR
ncbi:MULTISPECIES: ANTAR domain-containing protein [unclassified Nocardioides]|uniref:ANTAR domain-containing protein n=1 Tax=unclassified Nocardioides TaxID=2615069 RepID=UPI0036209074